MNFFKIKVKTKTWLRDSYGLFDYETNDLIRNHITIDKKGYLTREGNEIKFLEENKDNMNEHKKIISFSEENGFFSINVLKFII